MKKTLALLVIVSSILLVGCGSGDPSDTTVGGKPALPADPNAPAAKKGSAPASPMTAPPGVKTGTPGG